MKILILAVGKIKDKRIASLSGEYLTRVRPVGIVAAEHIPDQVNASPDGQMEREGQEILKRLRPRDRLILLREDGKEYDSPGFANFLSLEMNRAAGRVVLAIGGPWGFCESVKRRAAEEGDLGIALSRMTFPHEMCFLFLTEQIYRAFSILQGSNYHHGAKTKIIYNISQ